MKAPALEQIAETFINPFPHRLFYYGEIKEHAVFLPCFEMQPIEYAIANNQQDPYPINIRRQIAVKRYPMLLIRYHLQFKQAQTHEEMSELIEAIRNQTLGCRYWFACLTPEEFLVSVSILEATFTKQKCTILSSKERDVKENYLSAKTNDWLWQLIYTIQPLPGDKGLA